MIILMCGGDGEYVNDLGCDYGHVDELVVDRDSRVV